VKRLSWLLALVILVLPCRATAYDLVLNGGFETGSLASWGTFNQGASGGQGAWYAHTSGNGTYSGLPTSPPPAGSWQAVADNSGRAAAILYQDVTIPQTTHAVLSFTLWYGNAASGGTYANGSSLSPSITNQRVRIDIINPATNLLTTSSGVLQVVYATAAGSPTVFNPATITQDVTSLAGQTVRMRFAMVGTQGPIIAGIDKVKLEVSPFVPLPQPLQAVTNGTAHWGDFDGDGWLEVAVSGTRSGSNVWQVWRFNAGWWPYSQELPGITNGATAAGDFDGDGDLDLAGVGNSPSSAYDFLVYRNDGPNAFTDIDQPGALFTEPGTHHGSIDWGDSDGDGDLDALVSGMYYSLFGEYAATYFRVNDGSGNFTSSFPSLPGVARGAALWDDIERFGNPGVALAGNNLTDFYFSNGAGGFSSSGVSLPGVTNGAIAVGDLNNDGIDDLVVAGLNGSTRIAKAFNMANGTELPAGLTGVSESSVSLGDFDNDGWLDIALCGSNGSTPITRIYHNNGNGTFSDIGAALPGVTNGNLEFGDFDGDGDLDLLLQGDTGAGAICQVYLNTPPILNNPPQPPSVLVWGWQTETQLALGFNAFGSDDHTAAFQLSNNFRGGSSPGSGDIIPPMSNLATGRRLVPRAGESDLGSLRYLPLTSLGHGSLYWSVQTVDQCYSGSSWAPEQVLTVGPRITAIQDVPQDQGGSVRLTIQASSLDVPSRTVDQAIGYNLWRQVPGAVAEAVAREAVTVDPAAATARLQGASSGARPASAARQQSAPVTDLSLVEWNGRQFVRSAGITHASPFPAGTWEIIGSFFAMPDQGVYQVVASTIADSGMSGPHDVNFIVTVHTTTPNVWFASLPATGHSRDNLAPATPQWVTAAYHSGSGNHLSWESSTAADLHEYRVHRSTQPNFVPVPGTLAAIVTTPAWTDPSYDTPGVYYAISAVDHAGNQSGFAVPNQVTAVEPAGPSFTFALGAASPNPFRSSTRIGFTLPQMAATRLDIFDTSGRLVRTLADGAIPAGDHEVDWDGTDRSGRRMKAGIYFCRLQAGPDRATRRVVFGP
jgi:hypothetical protein